LNGIFGSGQTEMARQEKSKVKSMLIIFFDIKAIAQKEFVMAGQSFLHTIVTFYGDCLKICEDFAPNFGDKSAGCCIKTTHRIALPFLPGLFFNQKQYGFLTPPILHFYVSPIEDEAERSPF
jgi:hypothetical protein